MWGHLQVSFCCYLVFIQYSCFPQDRVQARVQHVVSVFLQLFVVKIQIWPDCSLIWSVITIFHISFAVTPSNAQPHTRPPMRINVPHHTSELHYFILHNMLICCSRTVCEEAKPTISSNTPVVHLASTAATFIAATSTMVPPLPLPLVPLSWNHAML